MCSYVFGAEKNSQIFPKDYEPLTELVECLRICESIMKIPGAICFYNPNGECLYQYEHVNKIMVEHQQTGRIPLELISNIRFYNAPNSNDWSFMDSIGMAQLVLPDIEVCFLKDKYDPGEVATFIRTVCNYIYQHGQTIKNKDTLDGPGSIHWRAYISKENLVSPPRDTIFITPTDGMHLPKGLDKLTRFCV